MAYFETLAAQLDTMQDSVSFTNIVSADMGSLHVPFEVAYNIPDVSEWQLVTAPKNDVGDYIAKLMKWMDAGVNFEITNKDTCSKAERYILETLRLIGGKETMEMWSMFEVNAQPAVIFTVNNEAVGFQKSIGVDTTYGLRDVPTHGLWAEVISDNNFFLPDFWAESNDVVLYELGDSDSFASIRPAVTAFAHAGRWRLNESISKDSLQTPLKRAALTMNHDDIVQSIDKIARKLLVNR